MNRLKQEKRWCVWTYEDRDGKQTKVPKQINHKNAKSNDSNTWATYEQAEKVYLQSPEYYKGVGLFFSDDLCGIDIDGHNEQGSNALANEVIGMFCNTYVEQSPSGTGYHILFRVSQDRIPSKAEYKAKYYFKNPYNELEFYAGGLTNRFFTFTGNNVTGCEIIEDETETALTFLETYMKRSGNIPQNPHGEASPRADRPEQTTPPEVSTRLDIARHAKNRDKFIALYDQGNTSAYGYDNSVADLALCTMLAFYLEGNASAIDDAFRNSALYREKWEREDYRTQTIEKAIARCNGEFFQPQPQIVNAGKLGFRPADFTDVGNAQLFVKHVAGKMIWTKSLGWLVWDGRRWEANESKATKYAILFSDRMIKEAYDYYIDSMQGGTTKASKDAEEFYRHAHKTRAEKGIRSMLTLSEAILSKKASDLDSNPFLLNTPSGTIDLRDGTMYAHRPEDYITKICNADPNDIGTPNMWENFIDLVTESDKDFARYLQETIGSWAIGKVYTEELNIACGSGRNGKSTMFNALAAVMGDYATTIDAEIFTTDRQNRGATLATMRGRRLIVCGELEEGQRLSVKTVKRIGSTDPVQIEQKYKNPETVIPSWHVVMFTNFLPKVGSTDNGTWRRLPILPFNATMPTGKAEIKDYATHMVENAGGAIIRWLIEGAHRFIENGMKIEKAERVIKATEDYASRENWFQNFIADCCECRPDAQIGAGELYNAYKLYARDSGEYCRRSTDFDAAMSSDDRFYKTTPHNRRTWNNIELTREWRSRLDRQY